MENDVLKNKIAPWQEKGRWYHATVKYNSSTGSWAVLHDKSDNTGSMLVAAGFYLVFFNTPDYVILDYAMVSDTPFVQALNQSNILHADIRDAIQLPGASIVSNNTVIEVWAFVRHR